MPYQVGSLTKLLMQLKGNRHSEGKNEVQLKAQIGDELVDILSEVVFIAEQLGIDLDGAFNNMIESDKKKIAERTK